jgi:hypothetical protein
LGRLPHRGAADLRGLRPALAVAGHRNTDAPDAGRSGAPPDAPVRHLPGLWRQAFSPSMRNSPCCPAP